MFASGSKTEALICEVAGKAVGYAVFFTSYSTAWTQWYLYGGSVRHPDYRGIGAGKALLKTIAQYAVQRQCGRLEWSVLDWNQPAIDFYLSIGAQPQDEWVRYRLTGDALRAFAGVKRLTSRSAPCVDLLAADQASTALFCSCGPASARRAPASVSLYCLKLSINS